MGTRTEGLGTCTGIGYTYRVLGYGNGMYPDVPSRTMSINDVSGTPLKKLGYVFTKWYGVPRFWVRQGYGNLQIL